MALTGAFTTRTVTTAAGEVEYTDQGEGQPVLFVHGSPGGGDQGALMTRFLVPHGFRIVAPSRPGYVGTPLDDSRATPDAQADLSLALLDHLGLDRVAVMCWSGGGPSSYRLVAGHPERVSALVALAAVSGPYTFEHPHEESILAGRLGHWLMKEMRRHTPKQVVKTLAGEEGDLTKAQVAELVEHIWNDPEKRAFTLDLTETVSGDRTAGLKNDATQFPLIEDLGLGSGAVATLLVHGTADADVPPAQSDHALAAIPGAEILRVADGTHLATWTDPTSDQIQARIVEVLRGA